MKIGFVVVDIAPYHLARFRACQKLMDVSIINCGAENSVGYESPEIVGVSYYDATLRRLPEVLSKADPDLLIVPGWAGYTARKAALWAIGNRCPLIVLSDSQLYGRKTRLVVDFFKKILIKLYSAAIVAGKRHSEYMQHFGMDSDAIFFGVDVVDNRHFSIGAESARKKSNEYRKQLALPARYALLVNRLVDEKNLFMFLEGYKLFLERRPNTDLEIVIAGDGPLKSDLIRMTKACELQSHIHFKGSVPYDELPKYYGMAEFFILNSKSETWGLTVNEAMAAGSPVLLSEQCGSAPDLVQEGVNGLTYDTFDTESLATCLCDFSDQKFNIPEMGNASREIISSWSPDFFANNVRAAADFVKTHSKPVPFHSGILLKILCFIDRIRCRR